MGSLSFSAADAAGAVTANISELDTFYKSEAGILLKYGVWIFTLLVFMLFDRLEEIKSENYT